MRRGRTPFLYSGCAGLRRLQPGANLSSSIGAGHASTFASEAPFEPAGKLEYEGIPTYRLVRALLIHPSIEATVHRT
jgi:hypothetical protein